jgi:hypothetical protein
MIDHDTIQTDLDALRSIALKNHDDQVALLCLATKAMYIKLVAAEVERDELSTVMVQLSSWLFVPNKREITKEGCLKKMAMAIEMINDALGLSFEGEQDTQPMEVLDEEPISL